MAEHLASDDADEPARAPELRRGTRLGRYELLLPVAKGGMARVWAARQHGQRGFSKLVALKTILPHLAREAEFERMFLDEARIASMVHHPNVCEIYELAEDQHVLYLAMEWVAGDSLMHVLRARRPQGEAIDWRVAARIMADACAGLHAAHELTDDDNRPLNVVHRDVSPHNILVSVDGHVKVADFGVAKALGQMHQQTAAGQIKGKVAYMAAEQITGTAVDRRSDVFALGVCLYEATTGEQPFKGDGDHQVMHALLTSSYVQPMRLIQGFPPGLDRILTCALSLQPEQRFATAQEMRLALEEWLAKTGPMVTAGHVAAVVRERIGDAIDRRKEKIRQASNAPVSSDATPSVPPAVGSSPGASHPSNGGSGTGNASGIRRGAFDGGTGAGATHGYAPAKSYNSAAAANPSSPGFNPGYASPDGSQPNAVPFADFSRAPMPTGPHAAFPAPPSSASRYAIAAAVGVGVVLAGCVALYGVTRILHKKSAPVAVAASSGSSARAAGAPPASGAPLVTADTAGRVGVVVPQIVGPIAVHVTPDNATVKIDGKPLPAGAHEIPRPAPGTSREVVVHADGFTDETVTLDEHSQALDLTLRPAAKGTSPEKPDKPDAKPDTKPDTKPDKGPARRGGGGKGGASGLPANPY